MEKRYYLIITVIALIILSCNSNSKKDAQSTTKNEKNMETTAKMQKAISTDGTEIGYWKSGSGPSLLLVHGTTADHSRWSPILPRFEKYFTVYTMDRRGRGGSSDSPDYDIMREAEDIAAVVEAIGEPVFLLGHSYGGVCSMEASLLTDKVSRLILYEPPIPTGIPMYPPGVPDRIQSLIDSSRLEAGLEVFFREVVKMPEYELAAYRQLPVWQVRIQLTPTIPRELMIDRTYSFDTEKLAHFQVPTMLLLGGDSPPLFQQAIELIDSTLPNSQVVILPGQQHIAMDIAPDLFVKEVLHFLSKSTPKMQKVISKDGTVIGYWKSGSGPPLLFVHGVTADHHSWYKITPLLEQYFTVYAMDRRGRGGSGDSPEYDILREAEDVAAVVESIGKPVCVFGHSYGGLCSLEAALLNDKIDKLILYEPPLPGIAPPVPPGFTNRIQSLVDSNKLEDALEVFYRELVKMPEKEISAMQKSPIWDDRVKMAPTIPRELSLAETYHFDAKNLSDLQVPTLLVLGGDSPPFARVVIDILNSAISDSKIVILPGQQHLAYYTNPEILVEELREFLQE